MTELPPRPWTDRQLQVVVAVNLVGLAGIVVAWWGAGNTATLGHQIGWVNLGVLALVLAVLADGTLLLNARRAIGQRRRRVLPDVVSPPELGRADAGRVTAGLDLDGHAWLWVPGTARAHRSGCQLVSGREAKTVSPDQLRRRSLRPCEECAG